MKPKIYRDPLIDARDRTRRSTNILNQVALIVCYAGLVVGIMWFLSAAAFMCSR